MVFIYIAMGLLAVMVLHTGLLWYAKASPRIIRHALIGIALGLFILLLVMLIRFGLAHLAAILSTFALLAPLAQRVLLAWRRHKAGGRRHAPPATRMSVAEARDILDVDITATAADIRAAHKRLIHKNHPDAGGTEYLASKINEARDVLLAHLKDNPS
jgi:DnaJ homolog subfamily C member 19